MIGRTAGLHVETFGSGPDLVMVHGWGMHSAVMRGFAERLADRVRVSLVDLPGHGRSGMVRPYSLDHIGGLLADAVPQPAIWAGWSLGALFALDQARRRPEAVRGLFLLAGTPCFVARPGWPGMAPDALDQFGKDLESNYFATARRFIGLQTLGMEDARILARDMAARLAEAPPPDGEALRGGLDLLCRTDLRAAVEQLNCPAAAIFGARDRLVPKEAGVALAELSPKMAVKVIDGAAHLPFLSHTDVTVEAWTQLVRRISIKAKS